MFFNSLFFSAGVFLIYLVIVNRRRYGRFHDDLYKERKEQLISIFKPLSYWGPVQYILRRRKTYSLSALEDMLIRAGCPLGIKGKHVILIKVFMPLITGGGLALYYGVGSVTKISGGMPAYYMFLTMVLSFYLPSVIIDFLIRFRRNKVAHEQGLFTEIVFMCLKARLSLREALEEASKTTDYLKPYLMVCLNEWLNDRLTALNNLKKNVGVASFQLIVDLLIQAATIGDENIADYIKENKRMEDELKNLEISANSKVRPLLLTLQMALPFIVILMVLFYPLVTQVEQLIHKI